jgi:hypothetical protein
MPDDLEVREETVRIGHKQYELTVRQQSMFVWLADGNSEGEALEGRGHSPRGAAQRWLEKAMARQKGQRFAANTSPRLAPD